MRFVLILLLALVPGGVFAGAVSLLGSSAIGGARGALFAPVKQDTGPTTPSLFIGRAEAGLFAERPAHEPAFADAPLTQLGGSDIVMIRNLIGQAESRRDGYDAVQHGARVKPPKPPTQMTMAEVFGWIKATPGQPHAIGRYQFVPKTLARVVTKLGVGPTEIFTPQLQDRLGDVLLAEAGLQRFRAGTLSRKGFMNNLAKIWAGLPNSTGKSHYDGYAGNKASMSWARFDAAMARIEPG